jgi:ribosomal protein L25 (general stress protein Ctc)
MANAKLTILERETDKNPRQIRSAGFLPGSIYGKGIEAKSIQINTHDFEMAYKNNQEGTWELVLGKEKFNAKIQELQKNFATNELLNVEFALV